MYCTKSIVVLAAFCWAAAQAGSIGRKSVESKDTVELTNNGISLKSGYEGYIHTTNGLAPRRAAEPRKDGALFSASQLDLFKALIMYKSSFLPMIGFKILKIIFNAVLLIFFGMASTALVCTFSPICNLSFEGSRPSFLTEKDSLPLLKAAQTAISKIPSLLKKVETPEQLQPEQPLAVADSAVEETLEQAIDPRHPHKNLDESNPAEENIDSRNSQSDQQIETLKSEPKDFQESEA